VGFEHSFDIYFSHNFHDVIDGALHMRQREERTRRGGGRGGFWFMFAGLVEGLVNVGERVAIRHKGFG